MRVLVTGSGGFIGSHLTRYLLDSGVEVLGIDNYNNYYSPGYKRIRFENIVGTHTRFISRDLDLCDYRKTREIIEEFEPHSVIHLAGQAGVRLPKEQNYKYIESNLTAFCNVMDATLNQSVKSFLYASSSSVYGNCQDFPLSENTADLQPISFYGSTKLANEFLASKLNKQSETNILGLRFFSVYGPWGRPDMAYFKILHALYTGTEFNVKTLETASGLDLNRKINPASALDVNRTEADFSRLQMMINFKPLIDIEQGAQTLIEWASNPKVFKYLKDWSD